MSATTLKAELSGTKKGRKHGGKHPGLACLGEGEPCWAGLRMGWALEAHQPL